MTETLKRSFPGMKSVKDMPILQDSPPPGGFPTIRFERRLPSTGPTGAFLFGIGIAVSAYGYYKMYGLIKKRRVESDEVFAVRESIKPLLLAERDMRWIWNKRLSDAIESEIMKDVPGWKVGEPTTKGRWLEPWEDPFSRDMLW